MNIATPAAVFIIYLFVGMPTSAMLSTMNNSFSSPARTVSGLQQSSPFLSTQPPAEDRYAALKDLDSLMKTQQASSEPQFGDWSTGMVHVLSQNFVFSGLNCAHVCCVYYTYYMLYKNSVMFGARLLFLEKIIIYEEIFSF